jgi:hypothetical protein
MADVEFFVGGWDLSEQAFHIKQGALIGAGSVGHQFGVNRI